MDEAGSQLDATQKTTNLIEQQRKSDNASKINDLREEREREKAKKIAALQAAVDRNYEKALELGLQLVEKLK
jgi:N-acetylglucosamine kinase-like BadF-type ATPase